MKSSFISSRLNFSFYQSNNQKLHKIEEKSMKQNISHKEITLSPGSGNKAKPNRHVSVLYGMQYLTRVPVVKRCRKTEYDCFVNINKKQIFTSVYRFVQKLLTSEDYRKKVLEEMNFDDNEFETTIIQNKEAPIKDTVLQQKQLENSFNEIQFDEVDENKFIQQKSLHLKVNNKAKSCKKISIMMDGGFSDFDDQSCGSALFSDQSLSGISSVDINEQQFTLGMVERIYEQPQPFLINLSVCLMLKFLSLSQTKLTAHNVCWILSIGTIVAYKIYYDEPVEGLIDSFAFILKIKREDIITLQRHFLGEINHEAVISNKQYHSTLYHIIRQQHDSK